MAKNAYVRDGSQWRMARRLHVRDTTQWREAQKAWVHNGTAWQQFFQKFTVGFAASYSGAVAADQLDGYDACTIAVVVNTDGSITVPWTKTGSASDYGSASGAWGSPLVAGIGAAYHFKWHLNSGNADVYSASADTWYALTSNFTIGINSYLSGPASRSGSIELYISADGGSTVAAQVTSSLTAECF